MTYLFFDTETTGFVNRSLGVRDPKQGRACQIAAILTTENGKVLSEFSTIIQPDGWSITEGAQNIHGWDDDTCRAHGLESRKAFLMFVRMMRRAGTIVAHNLDFDYKVMDVEAEAHEMLLPESQKQYCTMKNATNLCRIPKKKGSGYKWPKLEEATRILCGYELDGAHDAMADTRACMDVFFAINKSKIKNYGGDTPEAFEDLC